MSAYAVSFTSSLPPLIKPSKIIPSTASASSKSLHIKDNSNNDEQSKYCSTNNRALNISIKSANFDTIALLKCEENSKSSASSCLDDAVRFQLSISFNGRKYTAFRSFSKFVKLRRDLIKELDGRRKSLRNGMSSEYYTHSRKRRTSSCIRRETTAASEAELLLPKLPDSLSPNNRNVDSNSSSFNYFTSPVSSGFNMAKAAASAPFALAGRGFTMIHSLLVGYYCPMMERWLQGVTDVIDADISPAFNNFVWEPLRNDSDAATKAVISSSVCCSKSHYPQSSLSSINEDSFDSPDERAEESNTT